MPIYAHSLVFALWMEAVGWRPPNILGRIRSTHLRVPQRNPQMLLQPMIIVASHKMSAVTDAPEEK
jgi:hypothetical protein